ncbi:MAG TPA: OmpA family protein, partial [Gemmatimonadales bacterium]
ADEARLQAEREAAAARAAAMNAEREARAAAERAAESERRLRESVDELDRVIANVSGVRETERGLLLTLGEGLFATAQYELSLAARSDVGRIAAVLGQFPDRSILVEGHTDAVGSEASNQLLSERRANSVRAALIAEGIDPTRITATGYGESRPVDDNSTATGRARNRRVDIVILKPAGER